MSDPTLIDQPKEFFGNGKPKIYAYTTPEWQDTKWEGPKKGVGLLKIGYTDRDVRSRVSAQFPVKGPHSKAFEIRLIEDAVDDTGGFFNDHAVHRVLKQSGFRCVSGEWFECTVADVQDAILQLRRRKPNRSESFLGISVHPERSPLVGELAQQFQKNKLGLISAPKKEQGMAWMIGHGPLLAYPPLSMSILRALTGEKRILRLRRGLYLVPDATGRLPEIAETITLADPDGYISGPGALALMSLNDQDVGRWYSVSSSELADIAYGPLAVHFVHSPSTLARAKTAVVPIAGHPVRLATIAQALIDEIDLMPWGLDYPEIVRVMRNVLDAGRVNEQELLAVWQDHPSIAAVRRLGFILEIATGRASGNIAALARRNLGITGPASGQLDLDWRLRLPASREDIAGASR